jgi:hypothetical protein
MVFALSNIVPDITSETLHQYTWSIKFEDTNADGKVFTVKNMEIVDDSTGRFSKPANTYPFKLDGSSKIVEFPVFEEYVWDNMKDFVCSIIDGEIWVDGRDGNKQRLEHVMIHADLYFNLLENMSERIPYGKDKTNSELMEKSILKTIERVF